MAPAADAGDFLLDEDDEDFFADFNPHPYRGGYDLAATYGSPLPPSADTCYPVSSAAASRPQATSSTGPDNPSLEEPYEEGEEAPRKAAHKSPEVFRDGARREGKVRRRRGWRGRGLWRKCVRGLDYLFCYSDPHSERRIGVDSYIVPVHADRKVSGEDASAVKLEVAPPAVGRVEVHDAIVESVQSNELLWHSNYGDEGNTYIQPMYNSYFKPSVAQSYGLPAVLDKPDWFTNFSFLESLQVDEFLHEDLSIYCDQSDLRIMETPAHTYGIQSYMQISDVPLEPFKPSWSQDWDLYHGYAQGDALENDTHSLLSGQYGDSGSLFLSPFYPQDAETSEVGQNDEPVSFQQNWHNLSSSNICMADVSMLTNQPDDSYITNGSFWPFWEHSTYKV